MCASRVLALPAAMALGKLAARLDFGGSDFEGDGEYVKRDDELVMQQAETALALLGEVQEVPARN